jgi:hypothetical protein
MTIDFDVDGKRVQYFRDAFLGQSEIRTPDGPITVDSPTDLGTHFTFATKTEKTVDVYGRRVTVEKKRKQFFGGLLPADYKIFVDGELVVERSGY